MKILNYLFIILLAYSCANFNHTYVSVRGLANTDADCSKYLRGFKRLSQDSAAELELPVTNNLLKIITTIDGKVSGLMENKPLPDWFLIQYKDAIEKYQTAYDVPWDALTPQTKFDLVKYKTTFKETSIFEQRNIIGLKVRDKIDITFPKDTTFLGKNYSKGTHKVDFTGVFGPVEYCCNNSMMQRFSMVELHFRTNFSAGQVSNSAWTFLDLIKMKRNHQHVHVVGKVPHDKLELKPEVYSAMLGDFFRRANLLAEILEVYFYKGNISTNASDGVTYFNFLTRQKLKGVTEYFTGARINPGDEFKMGWVGMRGSDKYDQPGLWGLEYRAISAGTKPEHVKLILNSLQDKILNQNYGLSEKLFEDWLRDVAKNPGLDDIPTHVMNTLYHKDLNELILEATPAVREEIRRGKLFSFENTYDKIEKFAKAKDQYKMLIFDWSKDPLFFNSPTKIKKIEQAQIQALTKARNKINYFNSSQDATMKKIMAEFLEDSGILEDVFKSFDIDYKSL